MRSPLCALLLTVFCLQAEAATVFPDSTKVTPKVVETSATGDVALSTNLLYWLTATPNVGAEWATSDRFSLALSFGYNAFNFPNHNNSKGIPANPKIHHWSVMPEGRWWLRHKFSGSYLGLHLLGGQFNAGGLRFPKFLADHRYEGYALGAGLSYGYVFSLGRDWRMGASLGLGWLYLNYDKYNCGSCGTRVSSGARNLGFVTKAALSITYIIPKRERAREVAVTADELPIVLNKASEPSVPSSDIAPEIEQDVILSSLPEQQSAVNPDTLRLTVLFAVDKSDLQSIAESSLESLVPQLDGREIVSVAVDGYASPEYDPDHNRALSERRARAVAERLAQLLPFELNDINVSGHGDDWDSLVALCCEETEDGEREGEEAQLVRILSPVTSPSDRKRALSALPSYPRLLRDVYPLLRRAEVTVIYR